MNVSSMVGGKIMKWSHLKSDFYLIPITLYIESLEKRLAVIPSPLIYSHAE